MRARSIAGSLVAVVAVLGLAGCLIGGVTGSGAVTSETRQVGPFDRIEVNGGVGVTVHVGGVQSVQLDTHENLHSIIATEVTGSVLKIHGKQSFLAIPAPQVTITIPSLTGVSANGGSQVTADGISADSFGIEINGGAAVTATGAANVVTLDANGGARANLFSLTANSVVLDLSGGAATEVYATSDVSGDVSGGSRATVRGGGLLRVTVSGGGEVVSQ